MNSIAFYAPGARHYDNGLFQNNANSFVNISITGAECQCRCEHCRGQLLTTMLPAPEPEQLVQLGKKLLGRGCRGVLISGGACRDGSVPLEPFAGALKAMTGMGLSVVVHPGLLTEKTARLLAGANVTRVALDLIGDSDTIREVYHLPHTPADYQNSLRAARLAGLKASPHIVIGLHYGNIRGEYAALDMVAAEGAASLVLVLLQPLANTPMQGALPPPPERVAEVFQTARRLLPHTPLALGCARPPGLYARTVERLAVEAGFNAIAYPARETVDYVQSLGYEVVYQETCCGILP
ncbi:Aldolase-like protein [uncultured Sporomusa sp.]|uniref:Aldolase-like protein n=1 Tax=uncultured Sporomusa sp. TaxID=307249 RepID=A0A212LMS8_9FIRM|nr:radical SAM protein [uncultured Sporomusa sp.]SCM78833.1 Aldolase-like protein [uncultured Sporomusa sp.]